MRPEKAATLEQFAWTRVHGAVIDELRHRDRELVASDVTSLNTLVLARDGASVERIDALPSDDASTDPMDETAETQARGLPPCGREPGPARVVLLYVKNLTLREIGDVLGASESRVCQIHGRAEEDAQALARQRRRAAARRRLAACACRRQRGASGCSACSSSFSRR